MVPGSLGPDEHDAGRERMSIPELEGYMTATAASEYLKLTRQSINKKIRNGAFEGARQIGNQYLLPIEAVEAVKRERDELADAEDDEVVQDD